MPTDYVVGKLKQLLSALRDSEENLSIIKDRIRQYPLPAELPCHLEKAKRKWAREVHQLRRQIRELGILLLKPTPQSMFSVPREGVIVAGELVRLEEWQGHPVEVPEEIVHQEEGLFALKVVGNSMTRSLTNESSFEIAKMKVWAREGDLVILKRQQFAEDGDMVAVCLPEESEATLKYLRILSKPDRVLLQPANPKARIIHYDTPERLNVEGKVVAVVRVLWEQNAWLYIPWKKRLPGLILWDDTPDLA